MHNITRVEQITCTGYIENAYSCPESQSLLRATVFEVAWL